MKIKLYKLALFEKLELDDFSICRRVPGGWVLTETFIDTVFREGGTQAETRISSVFIPYNNEFWEKEHP